MNREARDTFGKRGANMMKTDVKQTDNGYDCLLYTSLAIRKEILQAVSEHFDTSVAAVESGIRQIGRAHV